MKNNRGLKYIRQILIEPEAVTDKTRNEYQKQTDPAGRKVDSIVLSIN